jgi:hypothetical protein
VDLSAVAVLEAVEVVQGGPDAGEQAASDALFTVAASTHKRYGQLLRLHAYPYIGKLRLSKLEPARLARLYARRIKAGLSPPPSSSSTGSSTTRSRTPIGRASPPATSPNW